MATKMSVAECRKYLPADLELTDKQVEQARDALTVIANATIDWNLQKRGVK